MAANALASGSGSPCVAAAPLWEAAGGLLAEAASHVRSWLSPHNWPHPSSALLERARDAAATDGRRDACAAEASLLFPLLSAYEAGASVASAWNETALARGEGWALSAALGDVLGVYDLFLAYHGVKAEVILGAASGRCLLQDPTLREAERLVGLQLRAAWLAFASRDLLVPSPCACRNTPETQSMLFEKFAELRQHGPYGFNFGLFQCGALSEEPDFSSWSQLTLYAFHPSSFHCAPADAMIRAACAQKRLAEGDGDEARRLMDAAVNLMALAAECFDHTPWTAEIGGVDAAEIFYNWALFSSGRPGPWSRLPPTSPAPPRRAGARHSAFARGMCEATLGRACVGLARGEIVVRSSRAERPHDAFLLQCGDSYGDWRRVRVRPSTEPPTPREDSRPEGWILSVSPVGLMNLWHLLHVLLPALVRLQARPLAPSSSRPRDGGDVELVLEGSYEPVREQRRALNKTFAWTFLQLLSKRRPLVIGETESDARGANVRCYPSAWWGHEAVTLFGRDKGALSVEDVRAAVDEASLSALGASRASAPAAVSLWPVPERRQPRLGVPKPWRVLLLTRPQAAKRGLVNGGRVVAALRVLELRGRLRLARVDFASRAFKPRVVAQWRLASLADVLVGPHGAGLAWAVFLARGRVLVELMPHMWALAGQLCRGSGMDSTPMYAYGGLALLAGLRHICLIGLPARPDEARARGVFEELASWHVAKVRANVSELSRSVEGALVHLDGEHAAGRLCPLPVPDELLC